MTKKNKKLQFKTLNFDRQIEGAAITKDSNMGWIKWGVSNSYPDLLLDLYAQSPTHHAAVNFGVQSIIGDGIDWDAMGAADNTQFMANYSESFYSLMRHISLDYVLYGSFAIQIIRNKDGKTFSFYHVPMHKVRSAPYDNDGQITEYFICSDWTKVSQLGATKIKAFDMLETEVKSGIPYLYVFKDYTPIQDYYTSPVYEAGIKAIQAEIEHLNFDLKSTLNSFVPSGMLVLPDQSDDEQRQTIIKEISKMFQGSDNSNALLVTFKNNVDESRPEFIPFAANQGNVNLFESADTRTRARILAAHQIPDAALCGLPSLGQTGFSSEGEKLKIAFDIYNKLVGNYNRQNILDAVNFMFQMNGIDLEIKLKPLSFSFEDNEITNDTQNKTPEVENNEINNNTEEKVE